MVVTATGAPVLKDAIASFDCKITQAVEVKLICDVVGIQTNGWPRTHASDQKESVPEIWNAVLAA
jgi:flavin reductase (DIM6/NTAB) family NADH-FMN oxidoreductase RutF